MSDAGTHQLSGVTYLQVRRDPRNARRVKVIKANQNWPEQLEPGCVLIKVRLTVPATVFLPYETPEIRVPANQVAIVVDTEDLNETGAEEVEIGGN